MTNINHPSLALINAITNDIFRNSRPFLPGVRIKKKNDVVVKLSSPVLIDGLSSEESALINSTLPQNAEKFYLSPLDKGLSGSKVFAAKYILDRRRYSHLFVLKIGPLKKIEAELHAVEKNVRPYVKGVLEPIFRRGLDRGLLAQELAGLGAESTLQSLRLFTRTCPNGQQIIHRLFEERLGNWYSDYGTPLVQHKLSDLFEPYLAKTPKGTQVYPSSWIDLQRWVAKRTGFRWDAIERTLGKLKRQSIRSISTPVHGDLHSQNILIDEHQECWPIDFAWSSLDSSPVIDGVMLECSLKFLAFPRRSELFSLLEIEHSFLRDPFPKIEIGKIPYGEEIRNILTYVLAVRRFIILRLKVRFEDYQKCLFLMTYALSSHPMLNRPYVLSSLQILSGLLKV